jgi:hypothetical protein
VQGSRSATRSRYGNNGGSGASRIGAQVVLGSEAFPRGDINTDCRTSFMRFLSKLDSQGWDITAIANRWTNETLLPYPSLQDLIDRVGLAQPPFKFATVIVLACIVQVVPYPPGRRRAVPLSNSNSRQFAHSLISPVAFVLGCPAHAAWGLYSSRNRPFLEHSQPPNIA